MHDDDPLGIWPQLPQEPAAIDERRADSLRKGCDRPGVFGHMMMECDNPARLRVSVEGSDEPARLLSRDQP
jgi:hypothetical protein